ncbi:MAG: methyltransferase [Candidatus Binatia bacterium]
MESEIVRSMDFSDLARLSSGHTEARILQAAVSLGIFEAFKGTRLDAPTLAASIHADVRATEILLNALVALGLLEKNGQCFFLTQISSTYLVRSSPKYFGGMVLFESSLWDCWGALEHAVRSGRPIHAPDMYQGDQQETERFISAMHSLVEARGDAQLLIERLDLSRVTELLDVGSGPGTYPVHFCRKYPRLRATIFDLPGTMKITERFIKTSGLENRIRLITGDYRVDPIPGSYQMVFLSNIIHAEGSEETGRLMAKIHACLDHRGRIVIKDHILDDTLTHPPVGAIFALLMLLTTEHGRCYSLAEVKEWLEKAGFARVQEIRLPHPLASSLVIGEKR